MTSTVLIFFGVSGWIAALVTFGLWREDARELGRERDYWRSRVYVGGEA